MPEEGRTTAAWYAAVWEHDAAPGRWVIRVSSTPDVDGMMRDERVCRDADEACSLLRAWLDRVTSSGD